METGGDLDERVPCPDGMCTGILGPDGRCGTCGRAGDDPRGGAASYEAPDEGPAEAAPDSEGASYDPDARVPCPDGMCTGILGPDGRCGTCGRASS